MSEFTEKENERSCQKKLAPPRSIRDAGGKTQIVWDMIAKRYPRAAPLLCEMETAIDRAETLLHQLRRVPYDNDIVTKIRVSPTPSSTNRKFYSFPFSSIVDFTVALVFILSHNQNFQIFHQHSARQFAITFHCNIFLKSAIHWLSFN